MDKTTNAYGIEGHQAPELQVPIWINGQGQSIEALTLSDNLGKFSVIYCFQAWCPGCHSQGFPSLQKMVQAMQDRMEVSFMAIQTVFEGRESNTFARAKEIQKEYDLQIPFGHDPGDPHTQNISLIMQSYRTGGTPWFIFIDQLGRVVFNDFHLDTDKAITFLREITDHT